MPPAAAPPTAITRLLPARIAVAVALSLLLALSARVQVPFWPVPMTLQTLAVLTMAGLFGPVIAGGAMLLYLAEGAAGLPVFAGTPEHGVGIAYLLGPTGGYLVGMLAAAVLVGVVTRRAAGHPVLLGGAMAAGSLIVYAAGAGWLARFIGLDRAIEAGVLPFLLSDAVKATLATALVLALSRRPTEGAGR